MRAIAEPLKIEVVVKTEGSIQNGTAAKTVVSKDSQPVSRFDSTFEKTKKSLSGWMNQKYEVILSAKDKVSGILDKLKNGVTGVIVKMGELFGVNLGFQSIVDTFAGFEAAMGKVKADAGACGSEFIKLKEKAGKMGAGSMFSAEETARGFAVMAGAGWKTKDMLDGMEGVMNLAAASGEGLGSAGETAARALEGFGLKASDSSHFADVLVSAATAANIGVKSMGESFQYAGGQAGGLGYNIEDTALALALMEKYGIHGAKAGMALDSILTRLTQDTDGALGAIKGLGVEFYNENGRARGLKAVMDELRESTKHMTEEEKQSLANTIAGKDAREGFLAVLNATSQEYDKLTKSIYYGDGASREMADTMSDNLLGAFTLLQNAADGVKISLGERLKPYLMDLAEWITEKMPSIERGLMEFMDFVDEKADTFKETAAGFTAADEWDSADLAGKISIAWDELIGRPFSQWWDGTGQQLIAEKAGSIGKILGTGLSAGLMALLGLDVSEVIDEAGGIGAVFAKSFADGFDLSGVKDKVLVAVGDIFSNAAKILPGGDKPGLSSWLSAAFLARKAIPAAGKVMDGAKLGKTIWKAAGRNTPSIGTVFKQAAGSFSVANEAAGTGMVAGSGLIGTLGKAGMALGSGAATSAGFVAAGGGSIAGGLAAAASLISGGMDLYQGFTARNEKKGKVYKASGTYKIGGAGAGAAAGAAIGSLFGGIGAVPGTLIGAGIGGIGGWFAGNKKKKEYEAEEKASKQLAQFLKIQELQKKFESKELKTAVADPNMTEAAFRKKLEAAIGENMDSHFGSVKLSLEEIKELSNNIAFHGNLQGFAEFKETASQAEHVFRTMADTVSGLNKMNWKASLGFAFDEEGKQEYIDQADALGDQAKRYVESRHNEAFAAISLILEPDGREDVTKGLDNAYSKLQKRLDKLAPKLKLKVEAALEDGILDENELQEIMKLQEKITSITQKVSAAQEEGSLKALEIKYGESMDVASFLGLQDELKELVNGSVQNYDEALKIGITSLELSLTEGSINPEQYAEQLKVLTDGYNGKISELELKVENFQLETIADAYAKELEGILPEVEGTTAEKLQHALKEGVLSGIDPSGFTGEMVGKYLGIEDTSLETLGAIAEMLGRVREMFPGKSREEGSLEESGPASDFAAQYIESLTASLLEGNFEGLSEAAGLTTGRAIEEADMEPINGAVQYLKEQVNQSVNTAFSSGFSTKANVSVDFNYIYNKPSSLPGFNLNGAFNLNLPQPEPEKNAEGSIITSPVLSWVGEDGPEAVIPLGKKRRSRGISLWETAGRFLGVSEYVKNIPGFGFERMESSKLFAFSKDGREFYGEMDEGSMLSPNPYPESPADSRAEINIDVNLAPAFYIEGEGGSGDIVGAIKKNIKEIADELGAQMADSLGNIFTNMPKVVE